MPFAPRYLRLVLSYTVAAVAAAICGALGHVRVAVRNPQTWSNVLQHKCGRFMLICVAWALVEMVAAMLLPRERDFTLQPVS
jgi:putative copper export protein